MRASRSLTRCVRTVVRQPRPGIAGGGALELQQMLEVRADPVAYRPFQRITQVLDLVRQVLQIELGHAPAPQKVGLDPAPGVEILLVAGARSRVDARCHVTTPVMKASSLA